MSIIPLMRDILCTDAMRLPYSSERTGDAVRRALHKAMAGPQTTLGDVWDELTEDVRRPIVIAFGISDLSALDAESDADGRTDRPANDDRGDGRNAIQPTFSTPLSSGPESRRRLPLPFILFVGAWVFVVAIYWLLKS